MKKYISIILVCMMLPVPAMALDLSPPDALHGEQVARATPLDFTDHLVKWPELNERIAYERDKTNDTIAAVAWVLIGLFTLNHGNSGNDGKDGKDGVDGKDGKDGGCKW